MAGPNVAEILTERVDQVNASGRGRAGAALVERSPASRSSDVEAFEIGAEIVGEVRPGERELHGRLEKAELVTGVETLALELDSVHRPALAQATQAVGELDLASPVWRRLGAVAIDVGGKHGPADYGEVR